MSRVMLLLAVLLLAIPALAQTDTPTPQPIEVTPPAGLYESMATAAAQINEMPDQITQNDNTGLVPDSDPSPIFSYAKWLFSDNAARELLGNTLAPIGIELFIILNLVIVLTAVYVVVRFIVLIIRGIIWIINLILKFIPFV